MSKNLQILVLVTGLTTAGCDTTESVTAYLESGFQQATNAVVGVFDQSEPSKDPIYICQSEGFEPGSAEYDTCVDKNISDLCQARGDMASPEYIECVKYYDDLQLVRRQVRIIGTVR